MFILPYELAIDAKLPVMEFSPISSKHPDPEFLRANPDVFAPVYEFDTKFGHNNDPMGNKELIGWYFLGKNSYPKWSALTPTQWEHARGVLRNGKFLFRDLVIRIALAKWNGEICPEEKLKWEIEANEAAEIVSSNFSYILKK